ncbi:MAG: hypothetical protein AAF413_00580 [Patescibacteria group bacterium]
MRKLRKVGLLSIFSTPITYIPAYALVATLVGEDRLEGPESSPVLGGLTLLLPTLVGGVLIAMDVWKKPKSETADRIASGLGLGLGFTFFLVGIVSLLVAANASDASIGAGILVPLGLVIILFYVFKKWALSKNS